MATPSTTRRSSPRAAVRLHVTLARKHGNPLASRTVDIGVGGMRVAVERPLTVDELVSFELVLAEGSRVAGRARVMRQEVRDVYALCFQGLGAEAVQSLSRLVAAASSA